MAALTLLCAQPAIALDEPEPSPPEVVVQEDGRARLVVLHRDGKDIPGALSERVDQLLLSSVSSQLHSATAYASAVPFEDVELAAGCSTREPDCMQRIAATLGADWLLVRELVHDASGTMFLTLVAQDGPAALVTRRAVAALPDDASAAKVVPVLVERLYPPTSWQDERAERGQQLASIAGWSASGAGLALLTVGVVMGALSRKAHRAYERTDIRLASDVDRAEDLLSRSQQRARVANGLLIGGAVTGVAGLATWLWTAWAKRDERGARLEVSPEPAGVSLSWSGAWRGAL